jgi:hypothetical protein
MISAITNEKLFSLMIFDNRNAMWKLFLFEIFFY